MVINYAANHHTDDEIYAFCNTAKYKKAATGSAPAPIEEDDDDGFIIDDRIIFNIYPNPANTYINVEIDNSNEEDSPSKLSILDIRGSVWMTKVKPNYQENIDISSLNPGIYFLEVRTTKGERQVKKFFKE